MTALKFQQGLDLVSQVLERCLKVVCKGTPYGAAHTEVDFTNKKSRMVCLLYKPPHRKISSDNIWEKFHGVEKPFLKFWMSLSALSITHQYRTTLAIARPPRSEK